MESLNRLDMLKKLSFITDKQLNIFSSYIPDHYDEIYTLYTLLNKASLNYIDIDFEKPVCDEDKFSFVCRLSKSDYKKIDNFLSENKNLKCMRNKGFMVSLDKNKALTYINFKHN